MSARITRRTGFMLLGGIALAVYALFFASSYDQRILTLSGVYVILVLGYQFIFGHAGALSLAQGAFFGCGAYVTGILGSQFGTGFLLTFPLSIAVAAAIAAIVAIPVLRLQTHYFALATLALSQLLFLIGVNWESVTGGANGLAGVPGITIGAWSVTRGLPLLLIVWAVAGLAMVAAHRQMTPRRVAAFTVMRETPLAAPAFGIDAGMLRLRAFLLSAAFGGAAGALFVHTNRVVSPDTLGFGVMITCLTMTVVGGRFGIAGAVIGALLLTHLPEWFRVLDVYYLVAVGALLLASVVFAPNGIVALIAPGTAQPIETPASLKSSSTTPSKTSPAHLIADNLSKRYGGIQALDNVTLRLESGEIVGVIGPNGAGKTTLANVLTGLALPDAGHILLGDEDLTNQTPHRFARAGVARTFQTPQLPDALRVRDVIATALAYTNTGTGLSAEAALNQFNLLDHGDTQCGALPHGVRRRVEICRAVAIKPQVLILDEPAAGLTPDEQAEIGAICTRLAETGLAILLIDHNVGFLRPVAARLICMEAGQVIADALPDETLADPQVQDAYFGMTEL